MTNFQITEENHKKYLEIITEIDNCLSKIKKDTGMLSFHDFDNHADYQKLINMGDKIIPYLFFYATQRNGFSWVILSLFSKLSGENPVQKQHYGKFMHIISDWMNWFIKSKYVNNNVYHGLVD